VKTGVHAFRLTLQFSFKFEFQYKSERSHGICLLHLQDLYFTIMQYRSYQKEDVLMNILFLSPVSFNQEHNRKKYVLTSLNESFCPWIDSKVPALLVGSWLNASSVADAANHIQKQTKADITVIPCGEQWEDIKLQEDTLRPAMEDYLGAGAILSYLAGKKSPEAELCTTAFLHAKQNIDRFIWDCGSGSELRKKGFGSDVTHCSRLNVTRPFLCCVEIILLNIEMFRLKKFEFIK
jgi:hypothetical protein